MSSTRLFCAAAFCVLLATSTEATVLVVAQRDPHASDENAGTADRPFKTISAAAARLHPGDTVVVHAGDYRETVVITTSGTKDAPIVIEAAPGETPVIKGSDRISDWTSEGEAIWKTNDVRQVFTKDGALFDAQPLTRVTTREAMKEGRFFCDHQASTLYVWLPGSVSPLGNPPEAAVRGAWLNVHADHVVIRGIQMRNASTTAIANWPACNLKGDDISLEKCTLTWGDFAGVSMSGAGDRLRDCLIACQGDCGVGGEGENHLIEGCRIVYNNLARYNPNWHAGGAKLIPNFRHGTIRHNEFAHNLGPGLWLDTGCDNNVIDGNLAHDNEGPGIMVEISRANLVLNNICYSNRNNLSGPYRDSKGVSQEMDRSAPRVAPSRLLKPYHAGDGRGIYISSAPATKVIYNTCYLNEAEGICVEGPPRNVGPATMTTTDEVVANNISVFNHGSQLTLHQPVHGETPTVSDHNLLFAVGAVFAKFGWEGLVALSLPEWQKVTGQNAHSLDADPHFAMAAMDDFRVLPGSPAVAAGQALPEAGHDFFDKPRDKAATTIGACEGPAVSYPEPAWHSLSELVRAGHQ